MAGIYIHFPFCRKKCNYCNFFSLATRKFRGEFLGALMREIELTRDYLGNDPVETIYFGGGTPSLFDVNKLEEIIQKMRDAGYAINTPSPAPRLKGEHPSPEGEGSIRYQVPEITMELNPEDVAPEYLEGLAAAGINRLSLGLQSFFDEDLAYLSRSHDAKQSERALSLIHDTGYAIRDTYPSPGPSPRREGRHNLPHEKPLTRTGAKRSSAEPNPEPGTVSVDLIYGIPTLTSDHWRLNLQRIIDLGIPHLSAYALTVEPKTPLAWQIRKGADKRTSGQANKRTSGQVDKRTNGMQQKPITQFNDHGSRIEDLGSQIRYPVSDEQAAEQFEILMDMMAQAGYIQYEISNFCLPGFESRHNSGYWKGIPYLGLGPSAHSYNGTSRQWNISQLTGYIRGIQSGKLSFDEEVLTITQRYNEYVMTSLRTIWGCDPGEITCRFGNHFEEHFRHQAIRHLESGNLLESDGIYILTRKGKFLADGISAELFMEE